MFCVELRNNVMAFRICLVQENEKKCSLCILKMMVVCCEGDR